MTNDEIKRELMRQMNALCLDIGERHLGSVGEAAAANHIQEQLTAAGYSVERQSFSAPGWKYGKFRLQTKQGQQQFPCFPCFYSCGGKACGQPLFVNLRHSSLPINQENFSGKIVIAHGNYGDVMDSNALATDLDRAGASALIIASPYQDTFSTKIVRQTGLRQLMVLTVSKNTLLEMACALKNDQLLVEVEAENFQYQASNIIAYLPEAVKKQQRTVVISAHYDTAPGIQGAGDDASGVAIILTLAKKMKTLFANSGVNVEIIGFTGEEYGSTTGCGYGAQQYVNQYVASGQKKIAWMVSVDDLGTYLGHTYPVVYPDRVLFQLLNRVLAEKQLKADYRQIRSCDVGPFNQHGIPNIFFSEAKPDDGNGHFPLHSPHDCLAVIDPDKLTADAMLIEKCFQAMLQDYLLDS